MKNIVIMMFSTFAIRLMRLFLSVVAQKIIESHSDKKCWIYYLNPHQKERQRAITDAGFRLKKTIKDKREKYF